MYVFDVDYRIPEDFALSLRTVYLWLGSLHRELTECRTPSVVGKKLLKIKLSCMLTSKNTFCISLQIKNNVLFVILFFLFYFY